MTNDMAFNEVSVPCAVYISLYTGVSFVCFARLTRSHPPQSGGTLSYKQYSMLLLLGLRVPPVVFTWAVSPLNCTLLVIR